jgi:hypothetical protein
MKRFEMSGTEDLGGFRNRTSALYAHMNNKIIIKKKK